MTKTNKTAGAKRGPKPTVVMHSVEHGDTAVGVDLNSPAIKKLVGAWLNSIKDKNTWSQMADLVLVEGVTANLLSGYVKGAGLLNEERWIAIRDQFSGIDCTILLTDEQRTTLAADSADNVVTGAFPSPSVAAPAATADHWNRFLAALIESGCYAESAVKERYCAELRSETVTPADQLVVVLVQKSLDMFHPTESPLADFLSLITALEWETLKAAVAGRPKVEKTAS